MRNRFRPTQIFAAILALGVPIAIAVAIIVELLKKLSL